MFTEDKVTEIFCIADDFCKFYDAMMAKYTVKVPNKRPYHRDGTLSKEIRHRLRKSHRHTTHTILNSSNSRYNCSSVALLQEYNRTTIVTRFL